MVIALILAILGIFLARYLGQQWYKNNDQWNIIAVVLLAFLIPVFFVGYLSPTLWETIPLFKWFLSFLVSCAIALFALYKCCDESACKDCLSCGCKGVCRCRLDCGCIGKCSGACKVKVAAASVAAASAASVVRSYPMDDLKIIEGIGPKVEEVFHKAGITSFEQVATMSPESLKEVLVASTANITWLNPETRPEQAQLAWDGKFEALEVLKKELNNGLRK